jgi:uncharacterized protein (DUF305 family)
MSTEHGGHSPTTSHDPSHPQRSHAKHYRRLAVMVALMFVVMYALMYAMVDRWQNVYQNVNQFYMAGLMTAAMLVIEIALMGAMYGNRKLNVAIVAAGAVALVAFWLLIRQQTAVADKQFLRSMIPHHAGAILMCDQASITDPDIKRLCESIRASQLAEIDQMKEKLKELQGR